MIFARLIKVKLVRITEIIHLRIFGHEIGEEMREFIGHLSWSFLGGIIAAGIMFVVNILAGRLLGPEEYGKYNAILSLATIVATLFLFGIDTSSVRYLADRKYKESQREIFTTAFLAVIPIQGIVLVSLFIWHKYFPDVISSNLLVWGSLLAIIISFKNLLNGFLRAFHEYKKQSVFRILDAGLVFVSFLCVVLFFNQRIAPSYVLSMVIGGVAFVGFSLWILREYFSLFAFSLLRKIFSEYNQYVLILSFIGMVLVSDKLIIGRIFGFEELGYFSAYYATSHLFVAELGGIFMNVFWPSVIKNVESMSEIVRKTTKVFVNYSPIWIFLIGLSVLVLFSFFGKGYPLRYDYVVLFSMNAFLGFTFSIFTSFLNVRHIRISVLVYGAFALFSIGSLILTKNITIYICTQILLQITLIYGVRRFLLKSNETAI